MIFCCGLKFFLNKIRVFMRFFNLNKRKKKHLKFCYLNDTVTAENLCFLYKFLFKLETIDGEDLLF